MSEEQTEQQHSAEEKFFGLKATFGEKGEQVSDVDIEVVDDRPEEDRRPPQKEAKKSESSDDDDELEGYSEKVKKRINKLRYQQHEERRQREAAEKMREEAIRVAQQYAEQSRQYQNIISNGEQALVEQIRARAEVTLQQAKDRYRSAYEEGNTDKVLEAQEQLMNAQAEMKSADFQLNEMKVRRENPQPERPQQPQQPQQQPVKAPPEPSPRAVEWAQENPWFGKEKDMTALAYGVHERLVRDEGIDPNSDEYYEAIDRTIRSKFPEYFGEGDSGSDEKSSSTSRSPSVVVAPSARNNGAKPRKVRLSRTQLSLAKRLGLTPEQYANQLIKES